MAAVQNGVANRATATSAISSHPPEPTRSPSRGGGLMSRMRSSFSISHRPALVESPSYKSVAGTDRGYGMGISNPSSTTLNGGSLPSRNGSMRRRRSIFRKHGRNPSDAPSVPIAPPQILLDANLLGEEKATKPQGASAAESRQHTVTSTFSTAASPRKRLDYHQSARLTVAQACTLLELCAAEIKMRGLAVVGIFRPLRSAESTVELARLTELFLLSSQPNLYQGIFLLETTVTSTLFHEALGKPDPALEFRRKLSYANIHDVVALFKWALRRLNLRCSDLRSAQQYTWYDKFVRQEKSSGYPSTAFSTLLLSSIEEDTARLFRTVFDVMATISAHHVTNAMPAHRICRTLGYWLFARVGVDHEPVNSDSMYASWEKAGQVTEHILLVFIREQASKFHLMPSRLTELVEGYPFITAERATPSLPVQFRPPKQAALLIETRTENFVVTPKQPRRPPREIFRAALSSRNGDIETSEDLDDWMSMVAAANGESAQEELELIASHSGDETAVEALTNEVKTAVAVDAESALFSEEDVRIMQIVNAELQRHRAIFEGRREGSDSSNGVDDFGGAGLTSTDSISSILPHGSYTSERRPIVPPSRSSSMGQSGIKSLATLGENDEGGASLDWNTFSSSGFGGGANGDSLQFDTVYRPKNELERAFDEQDRADAVVAQKRANKRRNKGQVPALLERRSPPRYILNSVSTMAFDECFASVWQDQLVDECPAARLPYLLCGQLNDKVAGSLLGNAGKPTARGSNQWLIIHETVIAPRPPKPPMEKSASSSMFFRRNAHRSTASLLPADGTSSYNGGREQSLDDDRTSLFSIRSGFSSHFGRSMTGVRKMRSMLLPRKSAPPASSYEASADEKRKAEINAEVEELQAAVYAERAKSKLQSSEPSTPTTSVPKGVSSEAATDYGRL